MLIKTSEGKKFVEEYGGIVKKKLGKLDAYSLKLPDRETLEKVIKLGKEKGFTVEEDAIRKPLSALRGPDVSRNLAETIPWGFQKVFEADGIFTPLDSYPRGDDMKHTMCIIDSGYTLSHPDLPNDVVSADPSVPLRDTCDHGTHVAGTIQASGQNGQGIVGVYPGAEGTKVVRVFEQIFIFCLFTYASDLIGAAEACADSGASVINMSLGGSGSSIIEEESFAALYDEGMLSIAAAGNSGENDLSFPSSYDSVVSVGATDINDVIASFSTHNPQVEISGPGVDVLSTVPNTGYASFDGTSMASPHVAGVALVLMNKYPNSSPAVIRSALTDGSIDLGTPGRDQFYGHGLVNYYNSEAILDSLCVDGVFFDASHQGEDYNLPCEWILSQNNFPISAVCEYPNGNAGEVCTCIC